MSKTKQLLRENGVTTRESTNRFNAALRIAGKVLKRRLSDEELEIFLDIYLRLMALDTRSDNNIPVSCAEGLGNVIALHIETGEKIQLVSFASPAYVQDLGGNHIDIERGENKATYRVLPGIAERVANLGEKVTYEIFLSDIDSEVANLDSQEIETLFANNLKGLQVHAPNAKRLSAFVDPTLLQKQVEAAEPNPSLAGKIKALQGRKNVQRVHKISPEAIKERALVYAVLGKFLEEKAPLTVILDIQSRIYPYEQPFYGALRNVSLPLIRPIKF